MASKQRIEAIAGPLGRLVPLAAAALMAACALDPVSPALIKETVATPTFNPGAGAYSIGQVISLSCSTAEAEIRYTTNGSTPTEDSDLYSASDPIALESGSTILKAVAFKEGMKQSALAQAQYTAAAAVVAAPTFNPQPGTYSADQSVSLSSATSGAIIYYTTDGTDPASSGTRKTGTGPVSVAGDGTTVTIRAIATKAGMTTSGESSAIYVIKYPAGGPSFSGTVVVGHELAKESVLRAIPTQYVDAARTGLHVAYQHTSHGTHVSYGLYGLQSYKTGDSTLFGVSTSGAAGKLDWVDSEIALPETYWDLSLADYGGWSSWLEMNRDYLERPANADINVVMWSWCDISNHNVSGYLTSMQTLIEEYGIGGSKIGTGSGKTRTTPITFVFMTGHAGGNYSGNEGPGLPKNQADLINNFCKAKGYLCLDYYSIDSHDMAGTYYADAWDDAYSESAGKAYNAEWQASHTRGTDWFYNRDAPGGSVNTGDHLNQHITANRKAYAMWYILARIAGWDGPTN
jgi:hypothetical protein